MDAAVAAFPISDDVPAGVTRKLSDERKKKIREKMRQNWADTRYRAMVAVARLSAGSSGSTRWLPPMTDRQRKTYQKLIKLGATREEALKAALSE